MRHDPRISQLRDDTIRHVASAFARSSREQHDVGDCERVVQLRSQRIDIVRRDAEPTRLAAQLANGIRQDLRVRVVDARRLHRLTWRDDLVAGREDRDDRLAPDVDRRRRQSRRARRCRGWSESCPRRSTVSPAVMSVPANDTPLPAVTAREPMSLQLVCPSDTSACSTMTTASAPRGIMPPVAMATASPGRTIVAGTTRCESLRRRGARVVGLLPTRRRCPRR